MKTKLLLFTAWLCFSQMSWAQSDADLENKYWNYRDRQRKYFTQIGIEPGQSAVAASIDKSNHYSDTWQYVNGVEIPQSSRNFKNHLKFGDAVVDHGYYLAVLASEYKLLVLQGRQNTEKFKSLCNEIYFAIAAIERLDQNAERYLTALTGGVKNGFFIRSDHDEEYIARLRQTEHQEIEKIMSGGAWGPSVAFIDSSGSEIQVYSQDSFRLKLNAQLTEEKAIRWVGGPGGFGTTYDWGNEMSQDQVYGLLMGFMCIKQWVDHDLSIDPDGTDPTLTSKNIVQWVAEITARIVHHVSRKTVGPITGGDISTEFEKFTNEHTRKFIFKLRNQFYIDFKSVCDEITSKPYIGNDTISLTVPDTVTTETRDSMGNLISIDTVLSWTRVLVDQRTESYSFPGSRLRSCNIWEEAVERYDNKKSWNAIFKESNYIITNPVRNHKEVTRGHLALPFGFPLRECAKYITGMDTFASPQAKLTNGINTGRFFANALWVVKVVADVSTFGGSNITSIGIEGFGRTYIVSKTLHSAVGKDALLAAVHFLCIALPFLADELADNPNTERLTSIISKILTNCPYTAPSPDLISLCIVGRVISPNDPDYWREVWNAMSKKQILQEAVKGSFTSNLQHNLALASRTWNHADFADWCDELGYNYSELFYAMLHGGTPIKSKSFYKGALDKAQCEGIFHAGHNYPDRMMSPYEYCAPFNRGNLFTEAGDEGDSTRYGVQSPGTDYMLLFNLYKMADLQRWNTGSFTTTDYPLDNCPCFTYPAIPYTSQVRSISENLSNNDVFIDGLEYNNVLSFLPDTAMGPGILEVKPVYDHYKQLKVRIPEYLGHDLYMSGTDSTSNGLSKLNVHQDFTICNGKLVMQNYTVLEMLANSDATHFSETKVNPSSTIDMRNRSVIKVNNNCKLVIEAGGTLWYNNGAKIILNGPNAVLHIKGKLILAAGATFKIEGGPDGKGYVIWDNGAGSPHYGKAQLIPGTGSKMVFEQGSRSTLALKIEGFGGMKVPNLLGTFKVKNCTVEFGPASRLEISADSTVVQSADLVGFLNANANPDFDYKLTSMGIHQLGRNNTYKNVDFHKFNQALTIFNPGIYKPLNLDSVDFFNCLTSVVNNGSRLKYNHGSIVSTNNTGANPHSPGIHTQLRKGIVGTGQQGASMVANVNTECKSWWYTPVYHPLGENEFTFNYNVHGNGTYYLYKNKMEGADYGARMDQAGLFPICCNFLDNRHQVFTTNGNFNASNRAFNEIHWESTNYTGQHISYFGYMNHLYLEAGVNRIMGHDSTYPFFNALVPQNQPVATSTDVPNWNPKALPAAYNQWQVTTGVQTAPSPSYNCIVTDWEVLNYLDLNKQPYDTSNWDAVQANYCDNYGTPFDPQTGNLDVSDIAGDIDDGIVFMRIPFRPEKIGDMITVKGGNGQDFSAALLSNLRKTVGSSRDYTAIIDSMRILMLAEDDIDTIGVPLKHVYTYVQDFYMDVFDDDDISEEGREAYFVSVYEEMLDFQNALLSASEDTLSCWRFSKFELVRDKALIQRVFNHRTDAKNLLNSVTSTWPDEIQKDALETWYCIINKEQMYLDSQITYEQLFLDSCIIPFAVTEPESSPQQLTQNTPDIQEKLAKYIDEQIQKRRDVANRPSGKNEIQLFPNPAENSVYIGASNPIQRVIIRQANGKLVQNVPIADMVLVSIDVSNLARGLYFIEVYSSNSKQVKTLMINK